MRGKGRKRRATPIEPRRIKSSRQRSSSKKEKGVKKMKSKVIAIITLATIALMINMVAVIAYEGPATIVDYDSWTSGNPRNLYCCAARVECSQISEASGCCEFVYKVDNWGDTGDPMDGTYSVYGDLDGDGITEHLADFVVYNDNDWTFDWELLDADTTDNWVFYMCAVAVKAGQGAKVYLYYDKSITSDSGLEGWYQKNISHVVFCFYKAIKPQEVNYSCETAYAYNETATPFIPTFSNWGWTIPISEEGSYEFDMYAGAGQCDITKGTLVGTVKVVYSEGTVTVEFELGSNDVGDYILCDGEYHVYAGTEQFPTFKGKPTVAPGQYTVGTGLSGSIYVIVHAVVGIPYYV
ncbi:MAG: hypothetical protein QW486_08825 [Candidatus Bathyarchaeia archaeon]